MNRTIKFRGKNLYNNEWIFGDLIQYESGEMAIFSNKLSQYGCEATEMFNRSKVYPETVGQFTGLLDKNGKEIYEGDILNNGQRNYFVCWNSERGAWWLKNKDLIYTTPLGFLSIELFVVGNIYDNPDLIKEE
jgi:hypothetical protein